ncbi:hypothetical protein [Pseudonocardia spinosispora]|uniref:hypothetical protein n=1 Tax=Pseudonocardia spinosispora TaxID=103441 RepID=UPI00048AE765|nr:hypothetical protein [Pseudonocardia spinosispora]
MGAVFGLVAFLIALVGLLAAAGNAGYLTMLSSAATKRGMSGEATAEYVRGQRTTSFVLAGVALVGLLLTISGGPVLDLIGLVLGGGAGLAGYRALEGTRKRFRN